MGGGATPSVRVEVDPDKLESFGLTMGSVQSVLSLQNSHSPRGQLSNGAVTADIITNDQISQAQDYAPLIVGYHNGAAIRLSDVAGVYNSTQNLRTAGYMDGTRAVFIIIFRQPGANIIQTNDSIRAQLPFLTAVLPQGIKVTTVLDRTTTIRASVATVERTLATSVVLVVLVVFIFLRSPRATLIPSVAVPVSLIGTFAVMYLLDYSIDNLSLMALTIATGFVVDDAIVVMENITRHLESGMPPFNAALVGAREIGFTVFSISMSLIAVFIPILMMGGIIGRLFREFAVTLSVAILVSMVISLTTTPMMCAHLLKHQEKDEKHNVFYRASEKFFSWLLSVYRHSLAWALDNPVLILLVLALTIALNVVVIYRIPKGFFPQQDTGAIVGGVQGPQDASFPFMNYSVQQLVKVIKTNPGGRACQCLHRRQRFEQRRVHLHCAEAAGEGSGQAHGQRHAGHQRVARSDEQAAGGVGVSAAGAGSAHWRALQQRALSVHDSVGQHSRSGEVGTASARQHEESCRGCRM